MYPDTLYLDELIGPDTVNTIPDATLEAFVDHGTVARTIDEGVAHAEHVWRQLGEVGVDMDDVAEQLEREGVASFQKSFEVPARLPPEKQFQFSSLFLTGIRMSRIVFRMNLSDSRTRH